jgi:hypothetical protein
VTPEQRRLLALAEEYRDAHELWLSKPQGAPAEPMYAREMKAALEALRDAALALPKASLGTVEVNRR